MQALGGIWSARLVHFSYTGSSGRTLNRKTAYMLLGNARRGAEELAGINILMSIYANIHDKRKTDATQGR